MFRRHFRWLVPALAVAAMPALADPLTADQKQAVEQVIHDYLIKNPDVMIEALKIAREKEEADAGETSRNAVIARKEELLHDPDSPFAGNPQGDVTIVEFFDYRCPYCKQVEPSLEALVKEDPKLRIVYKEYPILGPPSVTATRIALAARKQGKYGDFHHAMLAIHGQVDDNVVMQVAASVGIDTAKAKKEIETGEPDKLIRRNLDLASGLSVQGTPVFIVGTTIAPGAADIETLRKMVADARKAG